VSEHVAERARWYLRHGLVRAVPPNRKTGTPAGAIVVGRPDHEVWFHPTGVECDCRAGADHGPTEPRCSHAVAAMILWHELLGLLEAPE